MAKYHVNSRGDAGLCRAKTQCPFGNDDAHYATAQDARASFEQGQASFSPATITSNLGTVHLTPGVLDEAALASLTDGPCMNLARAMSAKSGYPVVTFISKKSWDSEAEFRRLWKEYASYGFSHAGVLAPDGTFIDAYGARSIDEVEKEYNDEFFLVQTGPEFNERVSFPAKDAPEEALSSFADAALKLGQAGERLPQVSDERVTELLEKDTWLYPEDF